MVAGGVGVLLKSGAMLLVCILLTVRLHVKICRIVVRVKTVVAMCVHVHVRMYGGVRIRVRNWCSKIMITHANLLKFESRRLRESSSRCITSFDGRNGSRSHALKQPWSAVLQDAARRGSFTSAQVRRSYKMGSRQLPLHSAIAAPLGSY